MVDQTCVQQLGPDILLIYFSRPLPAFVSNGDGSWKPVLAYIVPVVIFSVVYNVPRFMEFYFIYDNVTTVNGELLLIELISGFNLTKLCVYLCSDYCCYIGVILLYENSCVYLKMNKLISKKLCVHA